MMSKTFCRSERMRCVLGDLLQQLAVLVGELLLLQVDQLPEGHAEDGVGLDGRERVALLGAALRLRRRRSPLRPAPAAAGPTGVWICISRSLASAWVDEVRMTRITSSMLAWASSSPSTVCFRCRALASRNCVRRRITDLAVAEELLHQPLERQHPRLAVHQRQEDQREAVLQRRELVELVEHDLGVGVALQLAAPGGPAPSGRSRCGWRKCR